MSMALKNVIAALVLLTVGTAYAVLAAGLPERSLPNIPGPAFFPGLVATMILLLSAALLVKGLLGLKREGLLPQGWSLPLGPMVMLGWWILFLLVLPYVGFLVASIVFFAGLMLMCEQGRWWMLVAGSIAIPTVLFYLFRDGLNILLPLGEWM